MSSIGVFGGTFDPPHIAHLIIAQHVLEEIGLSRVLWAPVADQPLKSNQSIASIEHRVAMVQLAIADNPVFELSSVDTDRPGPHYTVDTLKIIAKQHPAEAITLIIGSDSLADLPKWHEPEVLVAQASIAVITRPRTALDVSALEAQIPGLRDSLTFIKLAQLDISATAIRHRSSHGRSIRYLVPSTVESYVQEHALYQDSAR